MTLTPAAKALVCCSGCTHGWTTLEHTQPRRDGCDVPSSPVAKNCSTLKLDMICKQH